MRKQKIGLWPVVALVIGSQIGVGVFVLPSTLAPLGTLSIFGWAVSGFGAIMLAIIFGKLCTHIPKAGGPHVFTNAAFGEGWAFFVGWAYWVISWTSNIAVIIAAVSYLSPVLGPTSKMANFVLEFVIFTILTMINLRGTHIAGIFEVFLTVFKCIPLFIIPIIALFHFDPVNIHPINPGNADISDVIGRATLLTFWGFIGLESATANASIIENPGRVVPMAVTYGTICVAVIYALNSIGIMGVVPNDVLLTSNAPYVDATSRIFGHGWDISVAIIACLACVGTLNAWILTSGQIAYGASKDGLFPKYFSKLNTYRAPSNSLMVAFYGTIPLLLMTVSDNLVDQINLVIDAAVTGFLGIYIICMFAFIKLYHKEHRYYSIIAFVAACFCFWVMFSSHWMNLVITSIVILSGLPFYLRRNGDN